MDEFSKRDDSLQAKRKLLAQKLNELRGSSLRVIQGREKLPQPLFWSLFHHEIAKLKKLKEKNREEQNTLYGTDL